MKEEYKKSFKKVIKFCGIIGSIIIFTECMLNLKDRWFDTMVYIKALDSSINFNMTSDDILNKFEMRESFRTINGVYKVSGELYSSNGNFEFMFGKYSKKLKKVTYICSEEEDLTLKKNGILIKMRNIYGEPYYDYNVELKSGGTAKYHCWIVEGACMSTGEFESGIIVRWEPPTHNIGFFYLRTVEEIVNLIPFLK